MNKSISKLFIFVFIFQLCFSPAILAETAKENFEDTSREVSELVGAVKEDVENYSKGFKDKFWFGLKNTLTGWTQLFKKPYNSFKDEDKSIFEGLAKGIFHSILQTVGGAANVVTSPATNLEVPIIDEDQRLTHRMGYEYSDPSHPDYQG